MELEKKRVAHDDLLSQKQDEVIIINNYKIDVICYNYNCVDYMSKAAAIQRTNKQP